jgi:O-antigen/teichoic acid export membrane protein
MIVRNSGSDAAAARPPTLARSAVLTYGTNVGAAFVSLANVLVIARALGAEGRGHVAFLTAIAWLVGSMSTLGVQEANANFAAAEPRLRRALATNSVLLSFLLGAVSFAALMLLIALVPAVAGDSDPTLRWITFAFVPVIVLQTCLRFLAQADFAFGITNAAYLLAPIVNLGVNGGCALFGVLSVETAVGVWLAGQTLETALIGWYVARRLAGFGRPDLALARRSMRFGAQAHAGRVMQLGNYRLDQWLLGAIAGPRELGLYSVAVAWAEALWYLPTALAAVQRPSLVRAASAEAARLAAAVFRAAALVTAVLALAMIVLAPALCVVVFGGEFRGSIDDLRILVGGAFGMVALKLFGNSLVARGRPVLQSVAIGVGFLATVLLDVLLIPPFGGAGAALASTLSYTAAGAAIAVIFLHTAGGRAADLVPRTSDVTWLARTVRTRLGRPGAATQPERPLIS